ncbi:hypothetical protein FRB94_003944 [Tulasnella sp. JGI-2019a]|nr:hypothetical protein FRB94_003944 [Tulasnella sp. JGI-2019a]
MVGTRKTTVVSYKDASDSESDAYGRNNSADLKKRKKKRSKRTHNERTTFVDVTLANSKTLPWTVLPLDIVYEIFRWLEPLDLLQLARSTRALRNHLMSKASSNLWKASRLNVIGGTPECPEYLSEPAFARLLFAEECFMRCCSKCLHSSFSTGSYITRKFPEIEDPSLITELLPSACGYRFYVPAIYEMATVIEDYENLILARTPGAKEAFESFKTAEKAKMAVIAKDLIVYNRWHNGRRDLVNARSQELRAKRAEVFTAKLLAEGYDSRDIRSAFWAFTSAPELLEDESGWIAIRSRAVKAVFNRKKERIERERKTLLNRRRTVAINLLMEHPVNINIKGDVFSPSLQEVASTFEPIAFIVDREGDDDVIGEDFEGALEGVEEWVEGWRTKKQIEILQIMVSAGAAAIADPSTEQDFARLKLATTMFLCTTSNRAFHPTSGGLMCSTLLGQRHIRQCRSKGFIWNTACLKYNTDSEEMIRQLVVAVGRDPETTTADQMDDLNARFYCQGCPKWDKLARSWRNCAAHFEDHPLATFQGWLVVPPVDTAKIICLEISNMADDSNRFKCSHNHLDYVSAAHFRRHCLSIHSREFKLEEILVDPLIPPQPISLDGETSEPLPPSSNNIIKRSRRRRRK